MDITSLVIEAQDARSRMQEARKRIKAEVRRKYEAKIAAECADEIAEAEGTFAAVLARVHAAGVPQSVLRREVLRTNVWNEWVKWRDMASIEPERVSTRAAKQAAIDERSPFRWAPDYSTLTVLRNSKGADVSPVTYDMSTNYFHTGSRVWFPSPTDESAERAAARSDSTPTTWARFVSDEIQAAIDAGHVKG
jgi:hypothetical protein